MTRVKRALNTFCATCQLWPSASDWVYLSLSSIPINDISTYLCGYRKGWGEMRNTNCSLVCHTHKTLNKMLSIVNFTAWASLPWVGERRNMGVAREAHCLEKFLYGAEWTDSPGSALVAPPGHWHWVILPSSCLMTEHRGWRLVLELDHSEKMWNSQQATLIQGLPISLVLISIEQCCSPSLFLDPPSVPIPSQGWALQGGLLAISACSLFILPSVSHKPLAQLILFGLLLLRRPKMTQGLQRRVPRMGGLGGRNETQK